MFAEYGSNYQAVDDTRADQGNDGYIATKKMLFARHCFVKPASKTDVAIRAKMDSDFKKAIKLKKTGKLEIERWNFICNYQLPSSIIAEFVAKGKAEGIEVHITDSTEIASMLSRHDEVRNRFADFALPETGKKIDKVDENVTKILNVIEEAGRHTSDESPKEESMPTTIRLRRSPPDLPPEIRDALKDDEDYKFLIDIQNLPLTKENKERVKAMAYSSSPYARISATDLLSNNYNPMEDSIEAYITMADNAIRDCQHVKSKAAEAVMTAEKLKFISHELVLRFFSIFELDGYASIGLLMPELDTRPNLTEEFSKLDQERTTLMKQSLELAVEAGDAETLGDVHIRVADSASNIGSTLKMAAKQGGRYAENADNQIHLAKLCYLDAQRYYEMSGNPNCALFAQHNLANLLRTIGEGETAIEIETKVVKKAKELKLEALAYNAQKVIDHTKAGKVPDYVNGETEIPTR